MSSLEMQSLPKEKISVPEAWFQSILDFDSKNTRSLRAFRNVSGEFDDDTLLSYQQVDFLKAIQDSLDLEQPNGQRIFLQYLYTLCNDTFHEYYQFTAYQDQSKVNQMVSVEEMWERREAANCNMGMEIDVDECWFEEKFRSEEVYTA